MEPQKIRCECGWEASVKPGKILSVICRNCGKKVWLKKPEEKVEVKEVETPKKRGRKKKVE